MVMSKLKCEHRRFLHACAECLRKPDPRYPANVWVTTGPAFHAEKYCDGVVRYQARNLRQGNNIHEPREVTQGEARVTLKKHPCEYCFPE